MSGVFISTDFEERALIPIPNQQKAWASWHSGKLWGLAAGSLPLDRFGVASHASTWDSLHGYDEKVDYTMIIASRCHGKRSLVRCSRATSHLWCWSFETGCQCIKVSLNKLNLQALPIEGGPLYTHTHSQ